MGNSAMNRFRVEAVHRVIERNLGAIPYRYAAHRANPFVLRPSRAMTNAPKIPIAPSSNVTRRIKVSMLVPASSATPPRAHGPAEERGDRVCLVVLPVFFDDRKAMTR